MERELYHYIAWRSRAVFMSYSGMMGGLPVNSDDRLWNTAGAPFVLSLFREGRTFNYAVKDEDAEALIGQLLQRCGDERRPYPFHDIGRSGEDAIADVNIGNEYYAFEDAALLKQWFEELREKCGEPLNDRELYHYTNPAPAPVTGSVSVVRIVEQAVIPPQPAALPVPPPDNCRSELTADENGAVLTVYCHGERDRYTVPKELLPEVNEAARKLLASPADGYHQDWDAAAWITIRERKEEFDVDPEGVLALFKTLADKCTGMQGNPAQPLPERIGYRDVKTDTVPRGGMFATVSGPVFTMSPQQDAVPAAPGPAPAQGVQQKEGGWFCPACGAQNFGSFCCECGSRKP